ncbi:MAG: AAA family ATPase [Caryophanon sp.]|nr:AAA family ATPase [Caryophanon sp.]
MLLKHMQVKNFRSFEQIEIDLSPSALTVIIGKNGFK